MTGAPGAGEARTEGAAGAAGFGAFVARAHAAGSLVVQPRMGMSRPALMRAGLLATRRATATTVGTVTIDSYTRTGDIAAARRAVAEGRDLNGYPLTCYGPGTTREVLGGVAGPRFPVQVRHGSPRPEHIVRALLAAGLTATEGGPVSYCLPYSRVPLADAVRSWERSCRTLAEARGQGPEPHLETFGGCMMGQLCPPGLLVAISVLEALFFRRHGLRSVSLSYAQQTSPAQDEEAVTALGRLAAELLGDTEWHLVIYTYMGVFPRTAGGAALLQRDAARLAVRTGAARLIVKTAAEAHRIPSVEENVAALESTYRQAGLEQRERTAPPADTGIYAEARALVEAVLCLDADPGRALVRAFARGYLDVPYCLHPDNARRSRSCLDGAGRLQWADAGAMPVGRRPAGGPAALDSAGLLRALGRVSAEYDRRAATGPAGGTPPAPGRPPDTAARTGPGPPRPRDTTAAASRLR
ncbi:methylaspartate mutase [Streptomyces sp. TRM 70351]|uniref:methylaspartate mutase n=1 Tax=Streptomyces sp. TRM 70351 TaxID=3116552 RepID=UPI002E7B4A45|nr:methylaspartate mutase [Streptomyces sp. TRM 70351]MEE1929020.1 methylaspartate mutase [Streptomyces sp. TRM 70351]